MGHFWVFVAQTKRLTAHKFGLRPDARMELSFFFFCLRRQPLILEYFVLHVNINGVLGMLQIDLLQEDCWAALSVRWLIQRRFPSFQHLV